MSFNRWMDKVVVQLHNGILLSHKKEYLWVSSNEVDETRAHYTQWSKPERERQISYINTYTRNLEDDMDYPVQGNRGDTDLKNRLLETVGEEESGMIWENSSETHTLPYVKQIASGSLLYDAGNPKPVLCDNLKECDGEGGGREGSRGRRHMCT